MLIGLAFLSYAATSIAMEDPYKNDKQDKPVHSQKYDVKKLLKTAAWYTPEALNFALGSWRFWYAGSVSLESIFFKSWALTLPSIADLNETMLSKEMISMIKETAVKMNVPLTTKVCLVSSSVGSCAAAMDNLLVIDPTLFDVFSSDEKVSTLAHEFSHLNHKDLRNQALFDLAAPLISYALLTVCEKTINRLLVYYQSKCSKDDRMYKVIEMMRVTNYSITKHFLLQYLLSLFFVNKVSRSMEFRADRESALGLGSAQGIISFMHRNLSLDFLTSYTALANKSSEQAFKHMTWAGRLYGILGQCDSFLRMPEHPSWQDRIKALELLKILKK